MISRSPNAPPQRRIHRVRNGLFTSNCYICNLDDEGHCFIVDPGLDPVPVSAALAELGREPLAVICTHGHFDHTGSAAYFQTHHGCKVFLDADDLKTLRASNFLLMAFKIPIRMQMPSVTEVTRGVRTVRLSNRELEFHSTPGHTPGSSIVQFGDSIFTGDTMYSRGVGLSKLPGEDSDQLRKSILSIWDHFPDETIVYPGHGDSASLGWIKRHNSELLQFLGMETARDQA